MKKFIDDKYGFVFFYPNEWDCEKEDNVISVYDPLNGLGALQFSLFYLGNKNDFDLKVELEEFLQDYESAAAETKEDFAYSSFKNDGRVWQYWLFQRGNLMILGSYNCEITDKGKEDGEINKILNSFAQYSIN